jgi:hypothetical protein
MLVLVVSRKTEIPSGEVKKHREPEESCDEVGKGEKPIAVVVKESLGVCVDPLP